LRWIVEGDDIVGLSFTELCRGTRFDGRYKTLTHGTGSWRCCPPSPGTSLRGTKARPP